MKLLDQLTPEQKRTSLLALGLVAVTALVIVTLLYLLGDPPNAPKKPDSYSLSSEDQASAKDTATLFTTDAATWGVRASAVTPETILGLREAITTTPSADIFLSRQTVYSGLLQNYIAPQSPLVDTNLSDWTDSMTINNLTTAEPENVSVTVPDEGYMLDGQPAVNVNVSFTSHQISRFQTANDTTWDGTFDELELSTPSSFELVMVKMPQGDWRAYSVEQMNHRFFLAITADDGGSDSLPQPTKIGTIQAPGFK